MTFLELLRSKKAYNCDVNVGGVDMDHSLVWYEDDIITDYGIKAYKALMNAECVEVRDDYLEVLCDDYKIGYDFFAAAAGYIDFEEHKKKFG